MFGQQVLALCWKRVSKLSLEPSRDDNIIWPEFVSKAVKAPEANPTAAESWELALALPPRDALTAAQLVMRMQGHRSRMKESHWLAL